MKYTQYIFKLKMDSSLWDLPDDIIETIFIDLFRNRLFNDVLNFALSGKFLYERFLSMIQHQCQDLYRIHKFIWENDNNAQKSYTNAIISNRLDVVKWLCEYYEDNRNNNFLKLDNRLAIKYGHMDMFIWLYKKFDDKDIETLMEIAAQSGHLHILKWLHNINPPLLYKGICFINSAASHGHIEIVKWLHEKGYGYFQDSINVAAQNGHFEVVKFLHSIGVTGTKSTIDLPASNGYIEIVRWLYEKGYKYTDRAIEWAALKGHIDVVKYLYEMGSICTKSTIEMAAMGGRLDCVKFLYSIFQPPTAVGFLFEYPSFSCEKGNLSNIIFGGYLDVLIWLYENKKSTLVLTKTTLEVAAESGHIEIMKWLYSVLPDVFGEKTSAMDHASANGNLEIINFLYEKWIEKGDNRGLPCTLNAIDMAAKNGHLDSIDFFYEKWKAGQYMEGEPPFTDNAIINAAENGHMDTVKYLYEKCKEILFTDAMMNSTIKGCQFKILRGLYICSFRTLPTAFLAPSNDIYVGDVAIDKAAANGHFECVKYLHSVLKIPCRRSTLACAVKNGHFEIVKWLDEMGVEWNAFDIIDTEYEKYMVMAKWLEKTIKMKI